MESTRLSQAGSASQNLAGSGDGGSQYLTFSVAGQMYGIGILAIKEIIQYGTLSPVPMMPSFIRGVINLRGAVVPVLDLAARFHGTPATSGRRSCIVVVELTDDEAIQDIGILVDGVSAVLEIPAEDIEPSPAFGAGIKSDFIAGMGKVNGRFVILLNVERVLETEDLAGLAASDGFRTTAPSVP